jgi:hypothetical protein
MVWPHQWDIVVGIPSPPEKGCGQSSYGELGYSCAGHRGGSHPMCVDALSCTCAECVHDHPVDDLCLAISLGMESCGLSELGVQHRPETWTKMY